MPLLLFPSTSTVAAAKSQPRSTRRRARRTRTRSWLSGVPLASSWFSRELGLLVLPLNVASEDESALPRARPGAPVERGGRRDRTDRSGRSDARARGPPSPRARRGGRGARRPPAADARRPRARRRARAALPARGAAAAARRRRCRRALTEAQARRDAAGRRRRRRRDGCAGDATSLPRRRGPSRRRGRRRAARPLAARGPPRRRTGKAAGEREARREGDAQGHGGPLVVRGQRAAVVSGEAREVVERHARDPGARALVQELAGGSAGGSSSNRRPRRGARRGEAARGCTPAASSGTMTRGSSLASAELSSPPRGGVVARVSSSRPGEPRLDRVRGDRRDGVRRCCRSSTRPRRRPGRRPRQTRASAGEAQLLGGSHVSSPRSSRRCAGVGPASDREGRTDVAADDA